MNNYQRISAEALGGGQINGELARRRAEAEKPLAVERNKVQGRCDEAQKLGAEIGAVGEDCNVSDAKADGVLNSVKLLIQDLQDAVKRAWKAKEAFRMEHGLLREPISPSVFMNVMVLCIMIFGEAFINAGFLQNAHMTATPASALLVSGLISATNIIANCVGGFFIGRWLNYGANAVDRNAPEFRNVRWVSRILQVMFIGVMGFLHGTIGLVRSQESLTGVHHSLFAYYKLLHTPEAVLLVILGVCLSVIAWRKGLSSFSDPYPHYGAYQKALNDAREALLDLQDELNEQIEDAFEDEIERSDKSQKDHQKSIQAYNKAVNHCAEAHRALVKKVSMAEQKLATDTAQILDAYRASGGVPDPNFNLAKHSSFQHFLNIKLPEFLPATESSSNNEKLNVAKAKALERLGALFSKDETIETPHEDKNKGGAL